MVPRAKSDVCPSGNKFSSDLPRSPGKVSRCPGKSSPKCPPNCRPINYCGRGPGATYCPPLCAPPRSTWKSYGPCQSPRCECPATWPTLHPHTHCCIREPRVEDPLPLPVMPKCRPPRWDPEQCKKKVLAEIPCKEYPPLIPCYSPCRYERLTLICALWCALEKCRVKLYGARGSVALSREESRRERRERGFVSVNLI